MPNCDIDVETGGKEPEQLRVYIAGPYTHGDWGTNQKNVIVAAQVVKDHGHIPFIPHTMTGLWSIMYDNDWLEFDLAWLEVCDAMVKLEGKSTGADLEEDFADLNDIEVYKGVQEFVENVDPVKTD